MPGKLSTHVLDLTTGKPAAGMRIELWNHDGKHTLLKAVTTNADGRTDVPLLASAEVIVGSYELLFFVKDYFVTHHRDSPFLDRVPVRFAIADSRAIYHVPLLVTPWAYPHKPSHWGGEHEGKPDPGEKHFGRLKALIAGAYYGSEIGQKELGWGEGPNDQLYTDCGPESGHAKPVSIKTAHPTTHQPTHKQEAQ